MLFPCLLFFIVAATPLDATIFTSSGDEELVDAIAAQLSDLQVSLKIRPRPELIPGATAQLRQVRSLLLGQSTRIAVWFEGTSIHVADVWSGHHLVRPLEIDSSGREAAALMVRSAVASFMEETAIEETAPLGLPPKRLRLDALWHASTFSAALPVTHGPWVRAGIQWVGPFSSWVHLRAEFPTSLTTEQVRLTVQRSELALGVALRGAFGSFRVEPQLGVAARLQIASALPRVVDITPSSQGFDVGIAAVGGIGLGFQFSRFVGAIVQCGLSVPLRDVRYVIQGPEETRVVAAGRLVEGVLGAGVTF